MENWDILIFFLSFCISGAWFKGFLDVPTHRLNINLHMSAVSVQLYDINREMLVYQTFKHTEAGVFWCVRSLDKYCLCFLDALILLECGWLSRSWSHSPPKKPPHPPHPLLPPSHLHAAQPNRLTLCIFYTHPVHVLGVLSMCMPCVCTDLMIKNNNDNSES